MRSCFCFQRRLDFKHLKVHPGIGILGHVRAGPCPDSLWQKPSSLPWFPTQHKPYSSRTYSLDASQLDVSHFKEIHLQDSLRGKRGAGKARQYWAEEWLRHEGTLPQPAASDRHYPLRLLIDNASLAGESRVFRDGIVFTAKDPLGKKLWRVANPIMRSGTVIWLFKTYLGILGVSFGVFGIYYMSQLKEDPITGMKRFSIIEDARQLPARLGSPPIQKEQESLPPDHPTRVRVESIMERLVQACGWPKEASHCHVFDDPGKLLLAVSLAVDVALD